LPQRNASHRESSPTFAVDHGGKVGDRFVSGLRVNASAIGGTYHRELLVESIKDAGSRDTPGSDLDWGKVVVTRADADAAAAPWFCPPRPATAAHFNALRTLLALALEADPHVALACIALFHQRFVRLHPFAFANQCLAMSLVNHVVRKLEPSGIPHLVLDHLALDLPPEHYVPVFRRAVRHWVSRESDAVQRTLAAMQRRQRSFAFMQALSRARSIDEARAVVAADTDGARLSLL
jgi:hypothetical protein